MTLTEFLTARIAEDRDTALAWGSSGPSRHLREGTRPPYLDPTRVLAECEKNRRIMALHRLWRVPESNDDWLGGCMTCTYGGPVAQGWPCDTLRALVLPYVDHPDYRQEWRP